MKRRHVCGLGRSRKLVALGVKPVAMFYWDAHTREHAETGRKRKFWGLCSGEEIPISEGEFEEVYPAFTVGELGDLIMEIVPEVRGNPKCAFLWSQFPFREYYPHTKRVEWKFHNPWTRYRESKIVCSASNEADARADMLAYLLEHRAKFEEQGYFQ